MLVVVAKEEVKTPVEELYASGKTAESEVEEIEPNYNLDIGNKALTLANDDALHLQRGMFGFTPAWEKKLVYVFKSLTTHLNYSLSAPAVKPRIIWR